jgi:hypothetical protein
MNLLPVFQIQLNRIRVWILCWAKYSGKHGKSPIRWFGINNLERAIVIHGAEYVSSSFIKQQTIRKVWVVHRFL